MPQPIEISGVYRQRLTNTLATVTGIDYSGPAPVIVLENTESIFRVALRNFHRDWTLLS